jgi:long-subunit fatty acid transport protein
MRAHQTETGGAFLGANGAVRGRVGVHHSRKPNRRSERENVAESALAPSAQAMTSLGAVWRAALGVNAPFGPNEPDNVTPLDFVDTISTAVGAAWKSNDAWSVRGGLAYDQGATRDRFRTPRMPGGDRHWLSAGLSHTPAAWLDLGGRATRIFVEKSDSALAAEGVGNQLRGDLSGAVESDVFIVTLWFEVSAWLRRHLTPFQRGIDQALRMR